MGDGRLLKCEFDVEFYHRYEKKNKKNRNIAYLLKLKKELKKQRLSVCLYFPNTYDGTYPGDMEDAKDAGRRASINISISTNDAEAKESRRYKKKHEVHFARDILTNTHSVLLSLFLREEVVKEHDQSTALHSDTGVETLTWGPCLLMSDQISPEKLAKVIAEKKQLGTLAPFKLQRTLSWAVGEPPFLGKKRKRY